MGTGTLEVPPSLHHMLINQVSIGHDCSRHVRVGARESEREICGRKKQEQTPPSMAPSNAGGIGGPGVCPFFCLIILGFDDDLKVVEYFAVSLPCLVKISLT